MKLAVIGAGGVGGYVGGKLAYAMERKVEKEDEIWFVARGEHGRRIQKHGLLLRTTEGDRICHPTHVYESVADLPSFDVGFLCVKGYDLQDCLSLLKTKMKDNTILIPLLNGVDIYERIRSVIHYGYVFPACAYIGTHIESPGIVTQNEGTCEIVFGQDKMRGGSRPDRLCNLLTEAGIRNRWSESHLEEIWRKYIFIAAYGMVTAIARKPLGAVYEDPLLRTKVKSLMREIQCIGQAEQIHLTDEVIASAVEKARNFPYHTRTSFQRDMETPGKKNERDLFTDTLISLGKKHGIAIPEIERAHLELLKR